MGLFDFGKKGGGPAAQGAAGTDVPVSQVLAMKSQGLNSNQIANQLRASGYSLTQIRDAMAQADIKSAVMPGGGEMTGGLIPGGPAMPPGMGPGPEMPEMPPTGGPPAMPGGQMPTGAPAQRAGPAPSEMEMPPLPEVSAQPPAFAQQPRQAAPAPMPQPAPMPGQAQMGMAGRGMPTGQLVNELQRVIEEIIEEKWADVEDKLNALDMWKVKLEGRVEELSNKVTELTARVDDFSQGMVKKTEEYQATMEEVGTEMEAVEKLMGKLVPSLAEEIKELRSVVDKLKKR